MVSEIERKDGRNAAGACRSNGNQRQALQSAARYEANR